MERKLSVLIVEDDAVIGSALVARLQQEGFEPRLVDSGQKAVDAIGEQRPDLVLLDVMLPDAEGFDVCRRLRENSAHLPVIMLTARDAVEDRVRGLDCGADDYLTKPFSFDELIARVRALWRRSRPAKTSAPLQFAHLYLDPASMELRIGSRRETLTVREYAVMELFMKRANEVLTRAEIFENAWDQTYRGNSNMVDVYVNYLRNKTQAEGEPKMIHTIRGKGYCLREPTGFD
jgi:two-component system, OmpR family, response regulator MprA